MHHDSYSRFQRGSSSLRILASRAHPRCALGLVLALLAGCSSASPASEREHVTALRGTITSTEGAPLSGVTVSAGDVHATTDARGVYDLHVPSGPQVVTYAHDGYVRTFERVSVVDGSPTQLDVTMLAMAPALQLDASTGGTVTSARGASIVVPPMGFVDPSGALATGTVDVHLTPIDPSVAAELAAAPGDFTAETGGVVRQLESFGMLDVTVESNGMRLQVAPGRTIEIHIPFAAGATRTDAELPVWSLDEQTGRWTDEGAAQRDAAGGTYVATTHHMSLWNLDTPYPATCLCGTVAERGAGPLPGAHVSAEGVDYFGTSEETTNAVGHFCLGAQLSSRVLVTAYHAHGGGTSLAVTTGSAEAPVPIVWDGQGCTDLGTIEVVRDVFTTSTGGTTECTSASNPFADACSSALWMAMSCFQPSGACTYAVDSTTSSVTTTYANGARMVSTNDAAGARVETYAADGSLCATQTVVGDGVVQYVTGDGATFVLTTPSGTSGDLTIGCPDGTSVVVTGEQRQALESCSSNTSGGSGGTPPMCTLAATGGPTGSTCTTNAQCTTSGDVCCMISGAPSAFCIAAGSCPT